MALLDGLGGDRIRARRVRKPLDATFQDVLIQSIPHQPEGRFEAMHHLAPLALVAAFVVHAPQPVDEADLAGLREKHVLIDETPDRKPAVEAVGFPVVAQNALQADHHLTSMRNGVCFAGSYRVRNREDDNITCRYLGSCASAHSAKP